MPIDLLNETTLGLAQATRDPLLQVGGKRPHVSTIFRWARYGLGGICLEYVRIGRRIVTSREALARFMTALADVDRPRVHERPTQRRQRRRSDDERARAIADAKRALAQSGVSVRSSRGGPAAPEP